jgi:hypothetical protein
MMVKKVMETKNVKLEFLIIDGCKGKEKSKRKNGKKVGLQQLSNARLLGK